MDLHYRELGTGDVVVVLHGLLGTGDNWTGVARALSGTYRVILVDAPNHGKSPWTDAMDYRSQASAVAAFIDSLGLSRVRLVGHSMGGKTAMAVSLQRPELVERAVVVDIAPKRYEPSHERILTAMETLAGAAPESRREADGILSENGIADSMVRAFLLKSFRIDGPEGPGWKLNLPVIRREYRSLIDWPDFGEARYDGRVGVLYGSRSSYVSEDDRSLFTGYFPSTIMRRIDGAGHWVHADKPREVTSALFEMLQ
ncbi:MAG: alpha/beta fold hydrolase [Spirochaetales bacterium]